MLNWPRDNKPKRKLPSETEWEAHKKILGGKCVICGKTEKTVGVLRKAHVKAHSKGGSGSLLVPMCSNCHFKYDHQQLTPKELKKIGLTKEQHKKLIPKKPKPKVKPRDSILGNW